MSKKLRAYMGYSHTCGSEEGACLIFAYNRKDARKIGFQAMGDELADGEWIDFVVSWLWEADHLFVQMRSDEPHIINCPAFCNGCELWGFELDEDGYCAECAEEALGRPDDLGIDAYSTEEVA